MQQFCLCIFHFPTPAQSCVLNKISSNEKSMFVLNSTVVDQCKLKLPMIHIVICLLKNRACTALQHYMKKINGLNGQNQYHIKIELPQKKNSRHKKYNSFTITGLQLHQPKRTIESGTKFFRNAYLCPGLAWPTGPTSLSRQTLGQL